MRVTYRWWSIGALAIVALLAVAWLLLFAQPEDEVVDRRVLLELLEPLRGAGAEGHLVVSDGSGMHVRYGETLDLRSFRARLNGADISTAFRPEPGKLQRVSLPRALRPGLNELVFELAARRAGGRAARATAYTVVVEH